MRRAPQYRPTLVDPYREYLRKRRAEEPAVPVLQLLREIRERGYTGSQSWVSAIAGLGRYRPISMDIVTHRQYRS